ncbi:hypothetical protein [Nonomuraea sp. NPDC049784]|uniref:hypothetical protein n=1 Tax=Nonomuraea sp. NPDC049784 TaxID=3154361 RepID=UPI00340C166B
MPVDFLSDSEAAKYGRYDGPPTPAEIEKIFFLDNEDVVEEIDLRTPGGVLILRSMRSSSEGANAG